MCDDFARSGYVSKDSCCPYCHEENGYLYVDDYVVNHPTNSEIKAMLCCVIASKVMRLESYDWDSVVRDRENSSK